MSEVLPPLRPGLDAFPSPDPSQPGLVLRDPMGYSPAILIIPPPWTPALSCFDGRQTMLDCQALLGRLSGEIVPAHLVQHLVDTLRQQGFLQTTEFDQMRQKREASFRQAAVRPAHHAGAAYPNDADGLRRQLDDWFAAVPSSDGGMPAARAIAAPHVSPHGGVESYVEAYRHLPADLEDRTVVILGTSHYGTPNRFGLTRKPYATPLGELAVDTDAVDFLARAAGEACVIEDYCHAVEHSIEFQCLFTRYRAQRPPRIVPILCGPLWDGIEANSGEKVERFFDALQQWAQKRGHALFWVLGIDLAHMGRRYGDELEAAADQGEMLSVGGEDRLRLEAALAGDAETLRARVQPEQDRLKWCGYAPLYTFLRVQPEARGTLLRYQQWNIDQQSVVSFAAMRFD